MFFFLPSFDGILKRGTCSGIDLKGEEVKSIPLRIKEELTEELRNIPLLIRAEATAMIGRGQPKITEAELRLLEMRPMRQEVQGIENPNRISSGMVDDAALFVSGFRYFFPDFQGKERLPDFQGKEEGIPSRKILRTP